MIPEQEGEWTPTYNWITFTTHRDRLKRSATLFGAVSKFLLRTISFHLNINQVIWSFIYTVIQHVILFDT